MSVLPIVWSIAGTDSGGGAGLSADQRAADAFGVHLCPVVAAVTAQHSQAVERVDAVSPDLLDAQLAALARDLRPAVIKTGLLGSAANVERVGAWVDRLREHAPVALVVDPVLGASTGRPFADDSVVQAYRQHLLPRATLLTPNRTEALRLLPHAAANRTLPQQAEALRALGTTAVAITGGDAGAAPHGDVLDWIDTPLARGWLALPRIDTPHTHGTGCTFASSAAAACALGFTMADALVLAKMATAHALRHAHAAGAGAGPVKARAGFGLDPALMPRWSWDEAPPPAAPKPARASTALPALYALVDDADSAARLLSQGVRLLQLRIKTAHPDRDTVARFVGLCRAAGALGFINDHWRLALDCGAHGVHLGQEDLLALSATERQQLLDSGLALGVSSHSLWELARARALAPHYIACGPVWPTRTKAMPWRPQGLDNLGWWCATAGHPVVAIGGLLQASQFEAVARCGVAAACAVSILTDAPADTVAVLQQALAKGSAAPALAAPALPHPMLAS